MTTTPTTRDEFFAALRENRERDKGRGRAAVAEELVDAAETFGDDEVTVSTLVELMSAYHGSGETVKYPVAFARLLRLWDANPKAFDESEVFRLHWYFKWVTSGLLATPDVPLASIRGWVAEMRRRYEAAGHDPQPVYAQDFHLARHLGENELLSYELWATRGRTEFSDCAACEARQRADFHFGRAEDERGLAELRPTFDGETSCDEEPHSSQALALLPLLRLGRPDEARGLHLTAYRKVRGQESELTDIGRHLEFCALTGNEARGLELLAQNRASFGFAASPSGRLEFLTGVEVLLARLDGTGHGALPCAGPLGTEWTVASLRATVAAQANELASRFDARNGNDAVSAHRRERLDRSPLVAQLNLGVQTAVLAPNADAEPVGAARPVTAAAPTSAPAPALPEDFAELFAEARALSRTGDPRGRAVWDAVIERSEHESAEVVDDLVRGYTATELARRALRRGDWDDATTRYTQAAEHYAAAGLDADRIATEARLVWCDVVRDGVPDVPAAAEAALPVLDELLTRLGTVLAGDFDTDEDRFHAGTRRLVALQSRALVARKAAYEADSPEQLTRWAEAFTADARRVIEQGTAIGAWRQVTAAHEVLGEFLARHGEAVEGELHARRAVEIFEQQGWVWRLPQSRMLLALALGAQGRHLDAMAELERAAAEAPADIASEKLTGVYRMLGGTAHRAGRLPTAVRAFSEAAARLDREGSALEARETRLQLGRVLFAQGSLGDGVAVLESLLDPAGAVGASVTSDRAPAEDGAEDGTPSKDDQLTAMIRSDLAAALMELGEPRDAAAQFLQLADQVSRWPEKSALTAAAAGAAHALALADNWDGARAAIGRALESNREAPRLPELTDTLRALALAAVDARGAEAREEALGFVDRTDELREEFAEAAREQFRSVDVDLAQSLHTRGRVLALTEQSEEALAAFERAASVYAGAGWGGTPQRFESIRLAALVEGRALSRADAARARLDAAASEADTAGLPQAATTLRRLRDSLQ